MTLPAPMRYAEVLGVRMAYRAAGAEDASRPSVLFLHGNPTSSFIWRRILPEVAPFAHCLAPDLIGFGASDKPAGAYRFADHARYLDAYIDEMGLASAYLVAQDWGTALAFHIAARRPEFVKGLVFMEFIRPFERWADFHQRVNAREAFRSFRTPGRGEKLVLEDNVFVEQVLPGSVIRPLSSEEMDAYRAPFPTPETRRPILQLSRELPIEGQPEDVHDALEAALRALAVSDYPKVLLTGNPGALVSPAWAHAFAQGVRNIRVVELGAGAHYLQEDHPQAISAAVTSLIRQVEGVIPASALREFAGPRRLTA